MRAQSETRLPYRSADAQIRDAISHGRELADVGIRASYMTRAVFLDRDGTLNVEKDYLRDPAELEILPGVPEALKQLQDGGFKLFIVTNQSGIGRGYYTLDDMHRVNAHLTGLLAVPRRALRENLFCSRGARSAEPRPQAVPAIPVRCPPTSLAWISRKAT
jgi:histidinol-phosphate phosphatase family protein